MLHTRAVRDGRPGRRRGRKMDKGELSLYRDTYEAGRRAGMEELARRIKEEMGDINMDIFTNEVKETVDECMKEALQG